MKYKLINGQIIDIVQDQQAESPDTWGNEDIFLVYDHRQFNIEREGFEPRDIHQYFEDYHEQIENDTYDAYYCFIVCAYIHGGVLLSLNHNGDRWDTSTTGYILVQKETNNGDNKKPTIVTQDEAEKYAEGLIEIWNQYLSGNVYGFVLYDVESFTKTYVNKAMDIESGEELSEVDSCWGYYAEDEEDALKTIIEDLNVQVKEEKDR